MGNYYNDPHRYDDIIDLPYPRPDTKPRATLRDWAGQYAPFAALSGYEEPWASQDHPAAHTSFEDQLP